MTRIDQRWWIGLLVCGIVLTAWWSNRVRVQLADRSNLLESRHQALEDARQELESLRQQVAGADLELEQARKERLELARLRNEVRVLRDRVASQAAAEERSVEELPPAKESRSFPAGPVQEFSSRVAVDVPSGDSLVLGGWETEPGRRLVILMEPSILRGDDGVPLVQVDSSLIDLPEDQLELLGLGPSAGEEPDSAWLSNLSKDTLSDLLVRRDGVDILSPPSIVTVGGRQGEIAALQRIQVEGEDYDIGPTIRVLPEILKDEQGVRLKVDAGVAFPVKPSL